MTSFFVESCRRIREGRAEFRVRVSEGKLAQGDRFDCLDGVGRQVRFRVQKIEGPDSHPTIECDGPITFDDQFARFYVVTEPFPPQRPDLPVPENMPRLTTKEAEFLKGWVRDWDYYHPLQQAAVVCVLRGEKTCEEIAETLSVKDADILSAFRGMSSVISRDCSTGELGLW